MSVDSIPIGFRILSDKPVLWIKFRSQVNGYLLLFLFPFIAFFVYEICWLIEISHLLLNLRFDELFKASLDLEWYYIFELIFLGIGTSAATFFALWHTFGITYFKISHKSLVVVKQIFGISLKNNIVSIEIKNFKQTTNKDEGQNTFPSWGLQVVTNQIADKEVQSLPSWLPKPLGRNIYKTITLIDGQSIEKSDWLGKLLADFYEVNYHSMVNPKPESLQFGRHKY
jgi:hypothetical protein